MHPYAFDSPGGFLVKHALYERHAPHAHTPNSAGRNATSGGTLQVSLRVQFGYKYLKIADRDHFEIHMRGEVSTLTFSTARKIGVPTMPIGGQALITKRDAYGKLVSGFLYPLHVFIGASSRQVQFLVGADPELRHNLRMMQAGILSPEQNTLRLEDAFSEHLICFDRERLYAFPDVIRQHRLLSKQTKADKSMQGKGTR